MEGLTWNDSYRIQIPLIDERNQRIIEIAAKFEELNSAKRKKDEDYDTIGEALADIMEFARMHFNEEEKILVGKQYPELNQHRREHKKFIKKIMAFRRLYSEDPPKVADDAVKYIRAWLPLHIRDQDSRYAPFVRVQNYLADFQALGRRGRS